MIYPLKIGPWSGQQALREGRRVLVRAQVRGRRADAGRAGGQEAALQGREAAQRRRRRQRLLRRARGTQVLAGETIKYRVGLVAVDLGWVCIIISYSRWRM